MNSKEKIDQLIKFVSKKVSSDSILADPEECMSYGGDWTKISGNPPVVFFPKTTEEVAWILKNCNALGISIIPSGGRTGLAGGASVLEDEVVLSLRKMNKIYPIDLSGLSLRVEAGAITEMVHETCEENGLLWPIDLASKGTCQIGGNLSTNAGGVRVIRYGMARRWVSGLKIVTMTGEIIDLNNGLEKNNTGYDLVQLLMGSEGTLAVITEATLKLCKRPKGNIAILFSLKDLDQVATLFREARKGPFEINAFEFFSDRCLQAVELKLKRKCKFGHRTPFYVLMEAEPEITESNMNGIHHWLENILLKEIVVDGLIAVAESEKKEVWALREGITESIALTNVVRKYDIAVPVAGVVSFLKEVQELLLTTKLRADLFLFGHFGDGSPHLNIVKHDGVDEGVFNLDVDHFEKTLFPLLIKYRGSISAEHGVGCLKKTWVEYSRSPFELAMFRGIKKAFDPKNLLNPGKVINL